MGNHDEADEVNQWNDALEDLFLETLRTYYQGTPMLTDSEFQTLRDELEHLGTTQLRLNRMEKVWMQATSARDFDRRIRKEFDISEEELRALKTKLLSIRRTKRSPTSNAVKYNADDDQKFLEDSKNVKDAEALGADGRVDERLKWFVQTRPSTHMTFIKSAANQFVHFQSIGSSSQMRARRG